MGTLYVVATPIGNLEDVSTRAVKIILGAKTIACEDTRRAGLLLQELRKRYPSIPENIHPNPKLIAYYDQTELQRTPEIIELLKNEDVILISDAGTPLINDPGYVLVHEARKRGVEVKSIPGPSALIAALSISGLPANAFTFLGYAPEKRSQRVRLFTQLGNVQKTLAVTYICYCAPHNLQETLVDLEQIFPGIIITIARELTKIHEEVFTGTISEAISRISEFKGEIVLLFTLKGL